jgi:hypothetical protein
VLVAAGEEKRRRGDSPVDAICADDHIAFFDGAVGEVNTHSSFSMLDPLETLVCLDSGFVWEAFVEMGHACLAVE